MSSYGDITWDPRSINPGELVVWAMDPKWLPITRKNPIYNSGIYSGIYLGLQNNWYLEFNDDIVSAVLGLKPNGNKHRINYYPASIQYRLVLFGNEIVKCKAHEIAPYGHFEEYG